jgi:NADH-quinone oxidoreductase subunit G
MLEIEIDGKKLTVPTGSTVMDAAHSNGTYIPHFCYHKKLSIAANCRMCLVEVEKAPKPLPACATPVTDGMKVHTHSDTAVKAQQGVMEFLLINHPLDCPICDQGGECQLQDLAVGYGGVSSRYQEEKRAVPAKEMGPLVSAAEMSRCIHCTRCVRFTEEIGGYQEIGMAHRGEHSQILPFLNKTVDSEISGNVIDLCPVGALTSKPFRYSARPWELSRRKTVSPHDGLGANMIVQVKHSRVMRALPLENEAINECWLADRDRFSYEALSSDARLTRPMVKQGGQWIETEWQAALEYIVKGLRGVTRDHGADAIGFLATPHSTVEELYLAKKLAGALGVESTDYRTRHADFSRDAAQQGALWLGSSIVELAAANALLVVGSVLRKEQPLLAARLRQSVKKGMALSVISPIQENLLSHVHARLTVSPVAMLDSLKAVLKAALARKADASSTLDVVSITPCAQAEAIADSLVNNDNAVIALGNLAQHSPHFGDLLTLANELARLTGGRVAVLGEAANSVGAELTFKPSGKGANAGQMFSVPKKAYVLLNTELDCDSHNPHRALKAVEQAEMVVAMSAFRSDAALQYADVMLPIAPFTETSGAFVNMEGLLQAFNGVVKPLGDARPAWKVLRVLGNMLGAPGFEFESAEQVRAEWLAGLGGELKSKLNNGLSSLTLATPSSASGLVRVGEVPMYQADALCRRAPSLQATADARAPRASAHSSVLAAAGVQSGQEVSLKQEGAAIRIAIDADDSLPLGVVRLAAAHPATVALGGMFNSIELAQG